MGTGTTFTADYALTGALVGNPQITQQRAIRIVLDTTETSHRCPHSHLRRTARKGQTLRTLLKAEAENLPARRIAGYGCGSDLA